MQSKNQRGKTGMIDFSRLNYREFDEKTFGFFFSQLWKVLRGSRLQRDEEALIQDMCHDMQSKLDSFQARSMSSVMYGLCKLQLGSVVSKDFFLSLSKAMMDKMREFNPQALANCIYAISKLDLSGRDLVDGFFLEWSRVAAGRMRDFNPQGLIQSLSHAISKLDLSGRDLVDGFFLEWSRAAAGRIEGTSIH